MALPFHVAVVEVHAVCNVVYYIYAGSKGLTAVLSR
jgi:hypothetical protein